MIPNVFVLDHVTSNWWDNLKVAVEENPDAWLFKGEVKTSLKVWICGSCGYTELYAENAAALLAAYRKREEQS